jgi:hypothetical protein
MDCPMCGQVAPDEAAECPHCTATLRFATPSPLISEAPVRPSQPLDAIRELEEQEQARDAARPWWFRYRDPAMTGAMAWFFVTFLAGLPGVLWPWRLLMVVVVSALIGAVMGIVIRLAGGGIWRGAVVSIICFVAENSFFPGLLCGGWVGAVKPLWPVVALFPGMIVGAHMSMRSD